MPDQSVSPRDGKTPQDIRGSQRQATPDTAADQTANMGNAFVNQFWKGSHPMMGNYNDLTAMHKETAAAAIRSGEILSKKLEEISQQMMTACRDSIEANTATVKAMLNVKTVNELFTLQSEWLRHSIERAMADGAKCSGWSAKIAKEIAEPVQEHYKATVRTFSKAA